MHGSDPNADLSCAVQTLLILYGVAKLVSRYDVGDNRSRSGKKKRNCMMKRALLIVSVIILTSQIVYAEKKIVILYTNDIMGRLKCEPAYFINRDFPPLLGNAGSCATFIKEERNNGLRKGYDVILLDAGNCFGNPQLERLEIDKTVEFMNRVEYDACAIGVYDTRLGKDVLLDIIDRTSFPWLSGNLIEKSGNKYIGKLYKTFDYDGVKVGVFGLTTEYGPIFVEREIEEQFFFEKEAMSAEEIVSLLQQDSCDIIVGLTNIGFTHDSLLADSISGIDIIVGGGEGRGLKEPYESSVNHTIICRTYGNLSSIGRLELLIDETTRKIIGYTAENITLFAEQFPPDAGIQKLIQE